MGPRRHPHQQRGHRERRGFRRYDRRTAEPTGGCPPQGRVLCHQACVESHAAAELRPHRQHLLGGGHPRRAADDQLRRRQDRNHRADARADGRSGRPRHQGQRDRPRRRHPNDGLLDGQRGRGRQSGSRGTDASVRRPARPRARRSGGRLPGPRGLPGLRRDLHGRRRSGVPVLHRQNQGLLQPVPDAWKTWAPTSNRSAIRRSTRSPPGPPTR